jgi:hypothetical protein
VYANADCIRRKIAEMAPILPPDYEPIPDLTERIKDTAPTVIRLGVVTVTLYQPVQIVPPYPVVLAVEPPKQADDPPSEDYSAPVSYSLDRGVQSSSSGVPFNNFDWPVASRRTTLHPSQMTFSTSAALLFDLE